MRNPYSIALEYMETAQRAQKNGFETEKVKKAVNCLEEIKKRKQYHKNFPKDKIYKAAKDLEGLVCMCVDHEERVKTYLQNLGLDNSCPCKLLYEEMCKDTISFVYTGLLHEDDSREEMKYFSRESKTREEFWNELEHKYGDRGIYVLFVDGPYIRESVSYTYEGVHSFNIIKEVK